MNSQRFNLVLCFVAGVAAAAAGLAMFRRPAVLPSEETPPLSQPVVVAPPADSRSVAFGTPPAPPPVEPLSDRQQVAAVQALENAAPAEVAPKLRDAVRGANDGAVLAVATTLAGRLPADDAESVLRDILAKGQAPPDAYTQLAAIYARTGRDAEACRIYNDMV